MFFFFLDDGSNNEDGLMKKLDNNPKPVIEQDQFSMLMNARSCGKDMTGLLRHNT